MEYRIVFHMVAEAELGQLDDDIAERVSPMIAWNFIVGIRDRCLGLSTFPQRGTERVEIMPGLRSVGYRRTVGIAFAAEGERGADPGVFSTPVGTSQRISPASDFQADGRCLAPRWREHNRNDRQRERRP